MGAGIAGLSASLLLARDGHRVTLADRDPLDLTSPEAAPNWNRQGIPHFRQPHALIPAGREFLREQLPDVYASLMAAGAIDIDTRSKIPGPVEPQDEQLQYLGVRRPLIEWALRRALDAESLVEVRGRAHVTGLRFEGVRVVGAEIDGVVTAADLVVDAMGRRSPTRRWLEDAGVATASVESSDCSVIYYSRYYQQRPDFDLPDGPWLFGPRGDLGYLGFNTFPGDNRTFAALLAVPTGDHQWRGFKEAEVFEAAVARIPALRTWVEPTGVDPITEVMAMAGLHNTLVEVDPMLRAHVVPIGDAYSHTDPSFAYGISFAMLEALELSRALQGDTDLTAALDAFKAATEPALRERYDFATAVDAARLRGWTGEPIDFAHRDGDYEFFSLVAAGAAAAVDPEIFRMAVRRTGLLDRTSVLDDDVAMQVRIEEVFAKMSATPRPPAGPTRDEMVELMAATDSAA